MAHGLNSVVLKRNSLGTSKIDGGNCAGSKASGIGSRRIFAPQFKLQVLDSYRNDADCKGNQRATARKYGIHRRQIQKWLQVETNLRNSVLKIKHSSINETISKPSRSDSDFEARKCGPEMAFSYHRQRDDTSPVAHTVQSTQHEPVASQITHSHDPHHMTNVIGPTSEQRVPFIPGSPVASVCTSPEAHRVPCVIIHTPPPHAQQHSPTPLFPPPIATPEQQKIFSSIKTEEITDQYHHKIDPSNFTPHAYVYPTKEDRKSIEIFNGPNVDEPHLHEMTSQFPYYSAPKTTYTIIEEPIDLSLKKSDRDLYLNQSYICSSFHYDLHTPAITKSEQSSTPLTPSYYNSTSFANSSHCLNVATPSVIDLSHSNYEQTGVKLSNSAEYEIWDLSTKSLKRKYEDENDKLVESKTENSAKKPVKLFKPYLDDDDYCSSNSSSPNRVVHTEQEFEPKYDCYIHSDFYHNNNNKLVFDQSSSYYIPFNSNSHSYYYESYEKLNGHRVEHFESDMNCGANNEEDATINGSAIIKQRQSYSLNFKLNAIECYYKDEVCRGNQRAVALKFRIHRRQIQKWLKQEHELRERIQTNSPNNSFLMNNNRMHVTAN